MTIQQILNIIGLTLDILGVIILFKFGLPSDLNKKGSIFLLAEGENELEKKKWKKYDCWSKVGLILIIIGFVLQVVSTSYSTLIKICCG